MFDKYRHHAQLILFFILVFISFATATYWIQWAFLAGVVLTLLIMGKFLSIIMSINILYTN